MATPTPELIAALRNAADRLKKGAPYQWGHMGSCNCGMLAQELIGLSKGSIHRFAIAAGRGDWNEQLNDYCPTTGLPMDNLIFGMLGAGLTMEDLQHLERLSDPYVLGHLPGGKRYLQHNLRADVELYFITWANLLEAQWLETVALTIPEATARI